ncbi:MAG TPA: T9SS type A sorting domain-containing protein, partial [Candidatus Kapabacteria bacterium]|nr:T9SS type A sorting domain-containing protein [Candidatus Kapabacteria bacterium]
SVTKLAGTGNALDFGLQTQAGTYTVTAENSTTLCTSNMPGSAVITINPIPNAVITGEISVIVGDEVSYTAENADNSLCYWFVTNGEIIGSSNANPVTIRWTNVGTGNVKLVLENTFLCKDSTEITIQIAPNFEYSIQGADSICLNTEANYTISGENGFDVEWTAQNAVIIGNSNEKNVFISFNQTGIATIFARITNNGTGQVFNLEKSVTVLELPEVTIVEFADVCLNESEFALSGGLPLGGEYSGNGVSNGNFYPGIAGAGEHTITYTYTNELGCSNSVSAKIKVNPLPEKPVLSFDGEKLTTNQAESCVWYLDSNEIEISSENYYYPQKNGNYSVAVIDSNGCQSELSDFLQVNFPKPVADIKIRIAVDSASVGDTIKIPIILEKATNLDTAGITEFTATLHLNSTMLKPIGNTPNGSIVGNIRTIQIDGAVSENSEFLYEMQFVVTLGNSECTQIIIDEINFIGGDYRLEKQDGVFCIKDLCEQNGTRLFAETYPIYLSECVPNPAVDEFSISYNLIEEAQTSLTIYNLFGTKVLTIFDKVATYGTFSIKQNIRDLTNGIYIIVLKTPSHNLARSLRVVK